jgi:hypothetical protein
LQNKPKGIREERKRQNLAFAPLDVKKYRYCYRPQVLALTLKDWAASKLFYEGNDSSFQAGVMANFFAISRPSFFYGKVSIFVSFCEASFSIIVVIFAFTTLCPRRNS